MGITGRHADRGVLGPVGTPAGKIETVITYLEMTAPPASPPPPTPIGKIALMRAEMPTLSYYRYLYGAVGAPWLWWERLAMSDDKLRAIIHHENVDVFALYVAGVPAGYFELDRRVAGEVELAYFGLIEDFIGRGFGAFLLRAAIDAAWDAKPRRVWVHTCNLDHPNALAVYQRAGFVPYDQRTEVIDDPRPREC